MISMADLFRGNARMNATRVCESDTASEEEEPDKKLQEHSSKVIQTDPDLSDTCSEEDLNIIQKCTDPLKISNFLKSSIYSKDGGSRRSGHTSEEKDDKISYCGQKKSE